MSELIIRRAEPVERDYKKIIDMGMKFALTHEMGALSARDHDLEKALGWVVSNVAYAAWIAEVDGEAVGSISLHEETTWYSSKPHLTDGWFYVLPEYRNSKIGMMLLETVKQFAEERGLPLLVGIFNMEDAEIKIQMLQRRGFKLAGGLFLVGE